MWFTTILAIAIPAQIPISLRSQNLQQASIHPGLVTPETRTVKSKIAFKELQRETQTDTNTKIYKEALEEYQAENYRNAIEKLSKIVEISPEFAEAHILRGFSFMRLEKDLEAMALVG